MSVNKVQDLLWEFPKAAENPFLNQIQVRKQTQTSHIIIIDHIISTL